MNHSFSKRMALRFIAGETLEEAVHVAHSLNDKGLSVTFDHLGENVETPEEARDAANHYCDLLQQIHKTGIQANLSVKLTELGLDLNETLCQENLEKILKMAGDYNNFISEVAKTPQLDAGMKRPVAGDERRGNTVAHGPKGIHGAKNPGPRPGDSAVKVSNFIRVDMESSAYTERTLRLVKRAYEPYKNVGAVIQAYLYRSEHDIESLVPLGIRIRLCKGAYNESREVAFPSKKDVDRNYVRLMKKLLQNGHYPAIATHDIKIIEAAKKFAQKNKIEPSRFEFQMLYGIRRRLQETLVEEGYNVRIYVPYGKQWFPYFMRRLAERPANLVFFLTNLLQ